MSLAESKKKGGRHTKKEQKQRRERVYLLHFEYGYSARKISKILDISRNTVNSDITKMYSENNKEYEKINKDDWLNKQYLRLEAQRAGLRKDLDSDITFREKIQIKKLIADLDFKIMNMVLKFEQVRYSFMDDAVNFLNQWMKKKGYPERYMTRRSLETIPQEARETIFKLLKEHTSKKSNQISNLDK